MGLESEIVIVIVVFGLILLVSCSGVVIGCRRRYLNKHAESVKPTDAPAFDFDDVNNLSALAAPPRNIALPTTEKSHDAESEVADRIRRGRTRIIGPSDPATASDTFTDANSTHYATSAPNSPANSSDELSGYGREYQHRVRGERRARGVRGGARGKVTPPPLSTIPE